MSIQMQNPSTHIPRPPNAFLCFRSWFIREQKAAAGQGAKMMDVSRRAADEWNSMSQEQRRPYFDMAARMKHDHEVAHPDYKFAPRPKGSKGPAPGSRRGRTQSHATGSLDRSVRESQSYSPPYSPPNSSPTALPVLSSSYSPPPSYSRLYLPSSTTPQETFSQRPDSWGPTLMQFGMPDHSAGFTPQEFLAYYSVQSYTPEPSPPQTQVYPTFQQADPPFPQQPQDFASLCQWDNDFARSRGASSSSRNHYRPY